MSSPTDKKPVEKIKEKAEQAARVESAPAPVRHHRSLLFQAGLILVAGAFGVLTFLVKTTPFFAVDLQLTRSIQLFNFPSFAFLMDMLSWPGYGPQVVFITGVIVVVIYGFGLHWEAVTALAAALFTTLVNVVVKDLVQRPRPAGNMVDVMGVLNSYSFPSGHVMFYIGFFGFIAFLTFSLFKPSWQRSLLLVLLGILIALIGISRIYLGQHWASDVLGAYLLGSLALVVNTQFYRWGKTRFFVHQPVAQAASHPA